MSLKVECFALQKYFCTNWEYETVSKGLLFVEIYMQDSEIKMYSRQHNCIIAASSVFDTSARANEYAIGVKVRVNDDDDQVLPRLGLKVKIEVKTTLNRPPEEWIGTVQQPKMERYERIMVSRRENGIIAFVAVAAAWLSYYSKYNEYAERNGDSLRLAT